MGCIQRWFALRFWPFSRGWLAVWPSERIMTFTRVVKGINTKKEEFIARLSRYTRALIYLLENRCVIAYDNTKYELEIEVRSDYFIFFLDSLLYFLLETRCWWSCIGRGQIPEKAPCLALCAAFTRGVFVSFTANRTLRTCSGAGSLRWPGYFSQYIHATSSHVLKPFLFIFKLVLVLAL